MERFTPKTRILLEDCGYLIYELSGVLIDTLRKQECKIRPKSISTFEFESVHSRISEAAINPNLFLYSNFEYDDFNKQSSMVGSLSREFKDVGIEAKAIIGEATDYAELAFLHLDRTDKYLFGTVNKHSLWRTRTSTLTIRSRLPFLSKFAIVGPFYVHTIGLNIGGGLDGKGIRKGEGDQSIGVLPLIVPVRNV